MQEGERVGASEAMLLNMLNISPFSYGLVVSIFLQTKFMAYGEGLMISELRLFRFNRFMKTEQFSSRGFWILNQRI